MPRAPTLTATLVLLALLIYPFAVYLGMEHLGPAPLALILGLLMLVRLGGSGLLKPTITALVLVGVIIAFVTLTAMADDDRVLRSYPVLINLALLLMFGLSLFFPPTMPERVMRLAGQAVPDEAQGYLWWVTLAWCGFFLVNGSIAAWTAWQAPIGWWTLYNGLLSYLFIGLFFGLEYLIRLGVKRRHAARTINNE